jgi:hypothetical protein
MISFILILVMGPTEEHQCEYVHLIQPGGPCQDIRALYLTELALGAFQGEGTGV